MIKWRPLRTYTSHALIFFRSKPKNRTTSDAAAYARLGFFFAKTAKLHDWIKRIKTDSLWTCRLPRSSARTELLMLLKLQSMWQESCKKGNSWVWNEKFRNIPWHWLNTDSAPQYSFYKFFVGSISTILKCWSELRIADSYGYIYICIVHRSLRQVILLQGAPGAGAPPPSQAAEPTIKGWLKRDLLPSSLLE